MRQSLSSAIEGREKLEFRLRWVYPWRRYVRAQRIRAELKELRERAEIRPSSRSPDVSGRIAPRGVPV